MKSTVPVGVALVIALVADGHGAPIPFTLVARGSVSGIVETHEIVVDSQTDWRALWARHAPGASPAAVDFASDVVIGIFAGRRPTAGYGVDIVAIDRGPGEIVVAYRVSGPPRDALVAQVLTSPFLLARLPRPGVPIRFRSQPP